MVKVTSSPNEIQWAGWTQMTVRSLTEGVAEAQIESVSRKERTIEASRKVATCCGRGFWTGAITKRTKRQGQPSESIRQCGAKGPSKPQALQSPQCRAVFLMRTGKRTKEKLRYFQASLEVQCPGFRPNGNNWRHSTTSTEGRSR